MDPVRLEDTVARALGRAALVAGAAFDLYRPVAALDPLAPCHRILRLKALLAPDNGNPRQAVGYGHPTWQAMLDAAYTRPGDYLVGRSGTWFIAAQQRLLPVLAVKTTRQATFSRAAAPLVAGLNRYGGLTAASATPLTGAWPVSMLAAGSGGQDAGLPADTPPGTWTILLPAIPGVILRNGDLFADDLARTATVASAELTDLGWRLVVTQATT